MEISRIRERPYLISMFIGVGLLCIVMLLDSIVRLPGQLLISLGGLVFAACALGAVVWTYRRYNELQLIDVFFLGCGLSFGTTVALLDENRILDTEVSASMVLVALIFVCCGCVCFKWGWDRTAMREHLSGADSHKPFHVHVLDRIQPLEPFMVMTLLGIRLLMIWYQMTSGIVISSTGGVMSEVGVLPSIILQTGFLISQPSLALAVMTVSRGRGIARYFGGGLVTCEFALAFLGGRRVLLMASVLAILVYLPRVSGKEFRKAVVSLALITGVVGLGWPFFFHTRSVSTAMNLHTAPVTERISIFTQDVLPVAWETFRLSDVFADDADFVKNIRSRGAVINPIVETMAAQARGAEVMLGRVLWQSVLLNVPAILWSGKAEHFMRVEAPEQYIQASLGLPQTDAASTVFWYGFADGGAFGLLLYMVAFGVLIGVIDRWLGRANSSMIAIFTYCLFFNGLFNTENGLEAIISIVRITVLLYVLDRVWGQSIDGWFFRSQVEGSLPAKTARAV